MKLESDWRHLTCNKIKNKIRMRTRWPPSWQFITKIWENIPWDWQTPGICIQNAYFIDSWIANIIVVTSKWCYLCIIRNLIYSRWQVLQTRGSSTLPVDKAVVAGPAGRRAPDHFFWTSIYAFRRVPFFSFWLIFLCAYLWFSIYWCYHQ